MRTKNIKVKLTIPVPIDEPDGNGNIYTKEAIEKAVENFNPGIPLITFRRDVIGTIDSLEMSPEQELIANGVIFYGGTCEDVENLKVDNKIPTVMDMIISEIGIDDNRNCEHTKENTYE